MGLVTDVFWNCPGCGSREQAQVYGDWEDPCEFPVDAVPASRELKWNPPCGKCGKFRLLMPEVLVKCEPTPVDDVLDVERNDNGNITRWDGSNFQKKKKQVF